MAAGTRILMVKFAGDVAGLTKASDAAEKQLDKGKGAFGKVAKAATIASAVIVGAAVAWGKSAISAAEEGIAAEKKLANVFEQMGGGASGAFAQAGDAAKQIGADLAVPATEVTNIQTKLATFGKIWEDPVHGAENFNRASTLAFDLAAAGFGNADSNASQLGKALQDPTKGMAALAKSGVTFSEAEKEKIKALQESGDLLGAQEMIYGALEKQVGGTAAAGVTDTQRMQVAIGELSESFGRMLLPAVQSVTGWIGQLVGWMEKNKTTVAVVAAVVVGLAAAILAVNVALSIWRAMVVVATAVQWAWNIAMSANPIGLIVLAIVALIAVIVLIIANWDTVKRVFLEVWGRIWADLKRFGAWIADVFWKNGLKKYFELWGNIIGWVRDRFAAGVDRIKGFVSSLLERILGLPGKVKDGLAKIGEFIAAPFRAGFGAAKDAWNNTVGGKGFDIPSWVPGLGGKSFRFPRFHSGGIVPGPAGREVPILAQAGEAVLTREQQDALGGGQFEGTLVLDSGEFLGVVRGVLRRAGGQTRRAALAGAGAAR